MTKNKRHDAILKLIESEEIENQEELTKRLNECGISVSQATVSRDINEMGVVKEKGVSKKTRFCVDKPERPEIPEKISELFKHIVVGIHYVNNMIIVNTLAGNASSAGMAVDAMKFAEILGTIAGDDTLLIIAKSDKDAENAYKILSDILR